MYGYVHVPHNHRICAICKSCSPMCELTIHRMVTNLQIGTQTADQISASSYNTIVTSAVRTFTHSFDKHAVFAPCRWIWCARDLPDIGFHTRHNNRNTFYVPSAECASGFCTISRLFHLGCVICRLFPSRCAICRLCCWSWVVWSVDDTVGITSVLHDGQMVHQSADLQSFRQCHILS